MLFGDVLHDTHQHACMRYGIKDHVSHRVDVHGLVVRRTAKGVFTIELRPVMVEDLVEQVSDFPCTFLVCQQHIFQQIFLNVIGIIDLRRESVNARYSFR